MITEGHECRYPGCTITTRGGKPYCPDHFDRNPHAIEVLEGIERMELEKHRTATATMLAKEIRVQLAECGGVATADRLSQDLRLELRVTTAVLGFMARAGQVRLGRTNRGRVVAALERGRHG